ncbi:MAG TPA: hypothetical protein VF525_05095 [Pyrinomonadaceae bacterium]
MADNNQSQSTLDTSRDPDLKPDATPNPVEDLNPANDERSLDIGESGQFAPGGYYNQRGATKPDRIDLNEQFPDGRDENK